MRKLNEFEKQYIKIKTKSEKQALKAIKKYTVYGICAVYAGNMEEING